MRRTTKLVRGVVLGASALVLAAPLAPAADPDLTHWPQWRGADGQGISRESGLPDRWSETENVQWKTPIAGRGHSSPIVWGERVFLTTAVEGDVVPRAKAVVHMDEGKEFLHPASVGADRRHEYKVIALDAGTGRVVWERTAWEGTPYDNRHKKSSFASPTPATDGRRVYAFFGNEGLYAYDFDGKLAWKVDLGKTPTLGMGTGTSPILHGRLVIVQCDEDGGAGSFIAGFDAETGREVWRTPRQVQVSWSTPLIVRAGGRAELVTSGNEAIVAYDPETGLELWRCKGVASNAIPSPVAADDLIVVSAGYPEKVAFAIRAGGSGDVSGSARILWRYAKGTAYVPSPILYGDYVYLMTDKGLLTCLDARTGEVKYEGGRVPVPATFTASPVAFDGKLLLLSEDGDGFLVKAGPVHELLGTSSLKEPVYASPALAGGRLYVRGETHLYCIGRDTRG